MSLTPLSSRLTLLPPTSPTTTNVGTNVVGEVGKSFSNILSNLESTQQESDGLLNQLAAGEDVNLEQLMIATQQTDISFKVAMAIRDRLVEAYKEVMRMTV